MSTRFFCWPSPKALSLTELASSREPQPWPQQQQQWGQINDNPGCLRPPHAAPTPDLTPVYPTHYHPRVKPGKIRTVLSSFVSHIIRCRSRANVSVDHGSLRLTAQRPRTSRLDFSGFRAHGSYPTTKGSYPTTWELPNNSTPHVTWKDGKPQGL